MDTTTNARLEALTYAHRKLLKAILIRLASGDAGAGFIDGLKQMPWPQTGEEDPGVLPTAAFAIETMVAEEVNAILAEVESELTTMKANRG